MINIKPWLISKLDADAGLLAALGAPERIVFSHPADFEKLSVLTCQELDNYNTQDDYDDDGAEWHRIVWQFDIWTRNDVSTSAIALALASVMEGLLFNRDYSQDIPDPESKTQHRVLRYSRRMRAADLT